MEHSARHFCGTAFAFTIWTLTAGVTVGVLSFDSRARRGSSRANLCGLGATMSGVIVSLLRTLLSCTSLARNGVLGGALAALLPAAPAEAADFLDTLSIMLDFNRQELAVLATALSLLGFSVLAAILLMRTRVSKAKSEA